MRLFDLRRMVYIQNAVIVLADRTASTTEDQMREANLLLLDIGDLSRTLKAKNELTPWIRSVIRSWRNILYDVEA